ncbi:MAG: ATP-binding cassette domain-containing protein, partial [Chitinophagales bacterium]|nr:ATP-binding cassette domain-containing protein [Chitinophagales bacterium]
MELKHISKSFGAQQVLTDISLVLEEGHTLAVLGKSGCGKTTLLRIIAGLELADNGEIWLNGKNMSGVAVHKRNAVYLN